MGAINASTMSEIVFQLLHEAPGALTAQAQSRGLQISAPSLEELHHEAREALICHLGPTHTTYRVKWRRI